MKQIDTSHITLTAGYPPSKKGLDFLQEEAKEVMAEIIQGQIGNTVVANQPYALYGCIRTGASSPYDYSAGAIYYNGEVYDFPAVSGLAIATNDRCTITITPDPTADPTTMTDGSSVNMHDVRAIVVSDSASAANDATSFDFSDIIYNVGRDMKYSDISATSTNLTAWQNMSTYPFPINSLKVGDVIELEALMTLTVVSAETFSYRFTFGGLVFAGTNGAIVTATYTTTNKVYIKGTITIASDTTAYAEGFSQWHTVGTGDNVSLTNRDRATITIPSISGNVTYANLDAGVSASSGQIDLNNFRVKHFPA